MVVQAEGAEQPFFLALQCHTFSEDWLAADHCALLLDDSKRTTCLDPIFACSNSTDATTAFDLVSLYELHRRRGGPSACCKPFAHFAFFLCTDRLYAIDRSSLPCHLNEGKKERRSTTSTSNQTGLRFYQKPPARSRKTSAYVAIGVAGCATRRQEVREVGRDTVLGSIRRLCKPVFNKGTGVSDSHHSMSCVCRIGRSKHQPAIRSLRCRLWLLVNPAATFCQRRSLQWPVLD